MKGKISRTVLGVLAAATLTSLWPAKTQPCDTCHVGASDYYEVLDVLFPRTRFENPYFVLRYLPSKEPERQIIIATQEQGNYEVVYFSIPEGSPRIWAQLAQLRADHPKETPSQLAARIKVLQRNIRINERQLSVLMKSLKALRIPAELDSRIVMDPSGYDFWFVAPSPCNTFHLSLAGADFGHDAKAHPLLRWMNRVRRAVEEAESAERQKEQAGPLKGVDGSDGKMN